MGKKILIAVSVLKGNSDLWSVGKSTVGHIIHLFCDAVIEMFFDKMISFPKTENEKQDMANNFLSAWQFPDCIGAIDGSHIPILAPPDYPEDYYNYKSYHSIVLMGVVDYKYRFT